MSRRDPISWFSISQGLVDGTRDSFVRSHALASVHTRYRKPELQSCLEFSSRYLGQSVEIQGRNLEPVSKVLSHGDVFPAEQAIFFFPPNRGVGNVAAQIANRQFPLLTIFLVGHFLVGEMSSLAAA
jgi:hypothetical protein